MKKRMHKLCTILTASALLAMSVTVYAAEGDNTEAGFQPAKKGLYSLRIPSRQKRKIRKKTD